MDSIKLSRRAALASTTTWVAGAALAASPAEGATSRRRAAFLYSLNTSTLRGFHLPLEQQVRITAQAGYHAIEPWVSDAEEAVRSGGSLKEQGTRIRDAGLTVESAIAFFDWLADDPARRAQALEVARRAMETVAALGGVRIAAPPSGATDALVDPRRAGERYRALLEVGRAAGVVPQAEIWGFSKTLGRLSDAVQVAMEADHPDACVLPDVFHLYKGGSSPEGFRLLGPGAFHVLHMNDYPADPPRERITDAERVFPGDGVAPLVDLLRILRGIGFRGVLSLELFNPAYWKRDPLAVAREGLKKMKAVVAQSEAAPTPT